LSAPPAKKTTVLEAREASHISQPRNVLAMSEDSKIPCCGTLIAQIRAVVNEEADAVTKG